MRSNLMDNDSCDSETLADDTLYISNENCVDDHDSFDLLQVDRRLIVCCDDIWEASRPFDTTKPSRVSHSTQLENTITGPQVTFYVAGFDTEAESVYEAYKFLVNNHCIGDEVYFYGFSQGALIARACADLVAEIGLCSADMLSQFWQVYAAYSATLKRMEAFEGLGRQALHGFLASCRKDINIRAVEADDTMWALDALENEYFKAEPSKQSHAYDIQNASRRLAKSYTPLSSSTADRSLSSFAKVPTSTKQRVSSKLTSWFSRRKCDMA
ncbi:MAG: hypothetical protein LQ340_006950 [Diploschistes diacapsis]|nr:MAG: hypothetical protein LQ340_006950 [Diploschistes diacapsis]